MPLVTKISPQKRPGFYNIFLDDEFWCGLTDLQVVTLGLKKQLELSDTEAESLKTMSDDTKAYHAAIRFLSYRMRSEREIMQYLDKKGYGEQAESAMERLRQERYIDDCDFAQRWVSMRQTEGKSPRMITMELMKKGVDKDTIASALREYESEDRQTSLMKAYLKQKATGRPLEKIIMYLQRKGWSYGDIRSAIDADTSSAKG